jgi:hypothetical protein
MTSAEPDPELTAFEQGTGRVADQRAILQQRVATPPSLSLGRLQWPPTAVDRDDNRVEQTIVAGHRLRER